MHICPIPTLKNKRQYTFNGGQMDNKSTHKGNANFVKFECTVCKRQRKIKVDYYDLCKKNGCIECWGGKIVNGVRVKKYAGIINRNKMIVIERDDGTEHLIRASKIFDKTSAKKIKNSKPNSGVVNEKASRYIGKIIDGYKILAETDKRNSQRYIIWECECVYCGAKQNISTNQFNHLCNHKPPKCDCQRRLEKFNDGDIDAKLLEQVKDLGI